MLVTKKEFIQQLVDKHRYTKKAAKAMVEDFWDVMRDNIEDGNTVMFHGYGRFELVERKSRRVCNPRTGELVVAPDHYFAKFFPGNLIKYAARTYESNVKQGLA